MKKTNITTNNPKKSNNNENIVKMSKMGLDELFKDLKTSQHGLTSQAAEDSKEKFGENVVSSEKKASVAKRVFNSFINPFTVVLIILAVFSTLTEVVFSDDKNPSTVIIMCTMILLSGVLRFIQETRSGNAAAKLSAMISTTTCVERRETGKKEIPLNEVVVGDLVHLSAGDMIPADIRILSAKDLFVSQSALTGESEPVEKHPETLSSEVAITERSNLAFMGSNVISGTASGVVVANGNNTMLGSIAKELNKKPIKTEFEKGVNSVSWVLVRFMLVMVPIVLFINGFTKGDWFEATIFAISVAVGLTPEMLPMIVTTCLAKGAVAMSKRKVITKNLNAIQNLGSIDILCTDKTGTLTQDKVVLEYHMDIHGKEDCRVLRHAFLNSYYQTGLKNLMDNAIIQRTTEEQATVPALAGIESNYRKVDEIPFDFERRRMSVVVVDKKGKTQMITKGAVEEMLKISSFVEFDGQVVPLTEELKRIVLKKVDEFNEKGMRVIAVAQKSEPSPVGTFSVKDEAEMVLIGYLAFLDPPKETAASAIKALHDYGVAVKILTGDNEKVTYCVCQQVGLPVENMLLGNDVENMSDEQLAIEAEKTTVFAKLSPNQKARIVEILRNNGHSVGYMGDGINDAPAMKASDVGISVDTAVDIAKESANIILLEKNLMVLEQGIIEGRKTYANMIKYIKMTASSNFGNMFSVLAASAFLPFLPMAPLHLILLNLIYDTSCLALPWDNVDREYLKKPRKWDSGSISRFMVWIGPTSSVFDIVTYLLLFFVLCPAACGGQLYHQLTDPGMKVLYVAIFQAGWFIESMWSQTLVIHMIRTPKIPFIQSHASFSVTTLSMLGIVVATILPYTPIGQAIGFTSLSLTYFAWLAVIVLSYMILVNIMKVFYIKRYKEFL